MEEHVLERSIIQARPEDLFAILTDFEAYPSWSGDVKAVRVLQRDEAGRGIRVVFRVAAFGRSTTSTLVYDYAGAPLRLSWIQAKGDLTRRYDGSYVFEAAGDSEVTEVTYQIIVELKVPLPGFVKRRAESLVGVKALRELKARAER